jgi:hypothetical protein
MRRLSLHASALNDVEYGVYTAALDDLAEDGEGGVGVDGGQDRGERGGGEDDVYYERLCVGVREARAWLRGRFEGVSASDIDVVCSLPRASFCL